MKKVLFLSFVLFLLIVFDYKEAVTEFRVLSTNIYFNVPDDWIHVSDKKLKEASERVVKRDDIPETFKKSVEDIKGSYLVFAKRNGTKNRFVGFYIVAWEGEDDIEEVFNDEVNYLNGMPEFKTINLNECPRLNINFYRCYAFNYTLAGKEMMGYRYLTVDSGYSLDFNFVASKKEDIVEMTKIARALTRKEV